MKEVAVIGFGGHVEKNIISAFERMPGIGIEAIYVRDCEKYKQKAKTYGVNLKSITDDIGNEVDWVYISTPISTHYELVKKYLKLGKNVICEKPLTDSPEKTKDLFELADNKGLRLHEVRMYQYHKQYAHLKNTVSENLDTLKSISARFTIPHLNINDVRYKKELGGGALLDVGYYPLSLFVSMFGNPKNIKSTTFKADGYDVDLTGAALFEYERFYCIAEWGIGLPYSNEVTVITENQVTKYDRIFSKPETFLAKAQIKEGFDCHEVEIGMDDHFVNMFKEVILGDTSKSTINMKTIVNLSNIISGLSQG